MQDPRRMIRYMAAALCLALCLSGSVRADTPIYVDGEGLGGEHILSGPDQGGSADSSDTSDAQAPADSDASSGSENSGVVFTPVPDEPEATPDPNAVPKWYYEPSVLKASCNGITGEVLSLGTLVTVLKTDKGNIEVYTRNLSFPGYEGAVGLAEIRAPKTGRCDMHKKANKKSAIIMKCQTGRIVPVFAKTKKYALVQYRDAVGYVALSALTMLEPDEGVGKFAYIAVKGNPLFGDKVKVRQKAKSGARILDEFPCGQRVTVLSVQDDWTEIEAQSLHCYILSKFLTELSEEEAARLPVRGIGSQVHANAGLQEEPGAALPGGEAGEAKESSEQV